MEWVDQLYKETFDKWKEAGADKSGFAIFYSPVNFDARITIIGYNPGGAETPDMTNIKVPHQHEYTLRQYRLAEKVYKVFESVGLLHELENSVKFNLIFFRSKKAIDINNQDLVSFSEGKVLEILNRLKPKIILAEGFITYHRLIQLRQATSYDEIFYDKRRVARVAKTSEGQIILGIIHPSGARGVSDNILRKIGDTLKHFIDSL